MTLLFVKHLHLICFTIEGNELRELPYGHKPTSRKLLLRDILIRGGSRFDVFVVSWEQTLGKMAQHLRIHHVQ